MSDQNLSKEQKKLREETLIAVYSHILDHRGKRLAKEKREREALNSSPEEDQPASQ